jgi:hypothetical protein
MIEQVKVLDWVLEIDTEATRAFYAKLGPIWPKDCTCLYCQNYVASCDLLPTEVLELFRTLGIDPIKEAEVYEMGENADGLHFYGGFYHIVGRIVEGRDSWVTVGPNQVHTELSPLVESFKFGFTEHVALVPKGFPEPVLQVEFLGNIPWVLEERP